MRFFLIAVLALSALPTYAEEDLSPACEVQRNINMNICGKLFEKVLKHKFDAPETTPKIKAENALITAVCVLAGQGGIEDCKKGRTINATDSCAPFIDMFRENVSYGCKLMLQNGDKVDGIREALAPLSHERRKDICRQAYLASWDVAQRACDGRL